MNQEELKDILAKHKKWMDDEDGGERADLTNADLTGAYLRNADLRNTDLTNTDLTNTDLRNADLRNADLTNTDLTGADLTGAYLRNADLRNADLRNADLRNTDLTNTDLRCANLAGAKLTGDIIYCDYYQIHIHKDFIRIGCQCHSFEEWMSFDDEKILSFDGKTALRWWRENKEIIRMQYQKLLNRLSEEQRND